MWPSQDLPDAAVTQLLGDNELYDYSVKEVFEARHNGQGVLILLRPQKFSGPEVVFLPGLPLQIQTSYRGREDLQLPWVEALILFSQWQF